MPLYEVDGKRPVVGSGTWIAPSAEIIGQVTIGDNCYIGFGAIIRADFGTITIGHETAVEEGVIIHEANQVVVGDRVIIGHMAMIHDATIEDCALVGMQSMICDYARIGTWAIVAEQSMVRKRQEIPPETIYGGDPARKIRDLSKQHRDFLKMGQEMYRRLPGTYAATFKKVPPEDAS